MREGTNTEMTLESAFQVLIKGKEIKKEIKRKKKKEAHQSTLKSLLNFKKRAN